MSELDWTGDIYCEKAGDYQIDTVYSQAGAFSTMKFCGVVIGYETDIDAAKEFCEAHAERAAA